MARFVNLTLVLGSIAGPTHRNIFVNPNQVSRVEEGENGNSLIIFADKDFYITVVGTADEVASKLDEP